MICTFFKWMISRSLDSDVTLPSFVEGHVGRCESCRRFLEGSRSLGLRLAREAEVLKKRPAFVNKMPPVVVQDYSFRLAAVTACVLILGGFLAFNPLNVSRDSGASISQVMPEDGVTTLLALTGITPETVAMGSTAGLGAEIDNLAMDAECAFKHLAGSLAFYVPEFN